MDCYAIEKLGITEELLMEKRRSCRFHVLQKKISVRGKKMVVFCDPAITAVTPCLARLIHSAEPSKSILLTIVINTKERQKLISE